MRVAVIRHCVPESCPDFQILSLSMIDRYSIVPTFLGEAGASGAQCLGCTSAKKLLEGP
jgi:hypothetical protein